jgi:hypothetical protein
MNELWNEIRPDLLELLAGAVVSILGAVIAWIGAALRRKLKTESEHALVLTVERVADLIVRDLEQTLVPAVKSGLADGKLTPAEADKIRQLAIDTVTSRIDTKVTRELAAHAVEAAVQAMKERRTTTAVR